jgi:hypothetical protein
VIQVVNIRHADGFLLGYELERYMNPPVKSGEGNYNYSTNFSWGFVLGVLPSSGAGGGKDGDNGKPLVGDSTRNLTNYPSLSGSGATQTRAGEGFNAGKFGMGGGSYSSGRSCGGGSGWYGGGSSYIGAGGGGGSGFVAMEGAEVPEQYFPLAPQFLAILGTDEYIQGWNEGDGYCKINGQRFEYTGEVQLFVAPSDNVYTIECFGGQGGGVDVDFRYSGGRGGFVKAQFLLQEGTHLYIYVGARGGRNPQIRGWNGGGIGSGGSYGGGGATDVRWSGTQGNTTWDDNLLDRFIVAGGGGGQYGATSEGFNTTTSLRGTNMSPSGEMNESEIVVPSSAYLVNDETLCQVNLLYMVSEDLQPNTKLKVKLFSDEVEVGIVYTTMIAGGGVASSFFYFSDWMPQGTPMHYVVLRAEISVAPATSVIVPPRGLEIKVSTIKRSEDSVPSVAPIVPQQSNIFSMEFLDMIDVHLIQKISKQETVGDIDSFVDNIVN